MLAIILVVENDPAAAQQAGAGLRGAGYQVVDAASRREANALLERLIPDLVVLEAELPDGAGLGAMLQRAGIPYIAFSAHSAAGAPRRAIPLADLSQRVFQQLRAAA